MNSLRDFHLKNNATMAVYNSCSVPSAYHDPITEYKAVRENALLVDYSHLSIISVMGDDAWALVNYFVSSDASIIRDEQGIYSLVLNEDGTIRGEIYVLCTSDGYYLLSEDISVEDIIECLGSILERADMLDIQDIPEIKNMGDDNWGAMLLEGPYSWEAMVEIYGFDVIGLPYYEYMNADDGLIVFRCGKHGEFAYMIIGQQLLLLEKWQHLLDLSDKYKLKVGGLDYQKIVRVENPGWDKNTYADYSLNPVELQMQWAVQYDKEGFIGKKSAEELSQRAVAKRLIGIVVERECSGIEIDDSVLVAEQKVGEIVKAIYSPAQECYIAMALIDSEYAWSDINGFSVKTNSGVFSAKSKGLPFIYNLSMLVNPTEHSFVDLSKKKNAL
ncbi:aminomethyltransferase family protein [Aeromonas veronii]|uniref:aminomethyltransferase family protein n=1 Tax=Aeromonas veronii TaxID=654 RepID=UPI0031FC96AB